MKTIGRFIIGTVGALFPAATAFAETASGNGGAAGAGLLSIAIMALLYFIPTVVASRRRHRNKTAIGALNLLLGWTLVGWVAALVWAMTTHVETTPKDTGEIPTAPITGWRLEAYLRNRHAKAHEAPKIDPPKDDDVVEVG